MNQRQSEIPSKAPKSAGTSLSVLRVLPICELFERSATLDGAIPLRAAQGCRPLLDGNAAGIHLRLLEQAVIEKSGSDALLRMTDEAYAAATADYDRQVEALVKEGLLTRDGYWYRELQAGFVHPTPNGLRLWSGLLVKPNPDLWLLIGPAANRRSLARIAECVVADADRFVPLFLDFDTASLADGQTWLTVELAVITVLRPQAESIVRPLREHPEPGRAFADFYGAKYFETKSKGSPTGAYRTTVGRQAVAAPGESATFELLTVGGLMPPAIACFTRFARANGYSNTHPDQARLTFAVAKTICAFEARSDGHTLRDLVAEASAEDAATLRTEWAELFGEDALRAVEQWVAFAHANQGPQIDPYVALQPWLVTAAPPGWSVLVDGFDFGPLEGMRGVISADTYPGLLPVWHFREPGLVTIEAGTPFVRLLPVDRQLLSAGWTELERE